MVVPLRQLPLDSSLQGIDYWGMSYPAVDESLPRLWPYRTDFVFPNVPPGSFGEGAKLRVRSSWRQPAMHF